AAATAAKIATLLPALTSRTTLNATHSDTKTKKPPATQAPTYNQRARIACILGKRALASVTTAATGNSAAILPHAKSAARKSGAQILVALPLNRSEALSSSPK